MIDLTGKYEDVSARDYVVMEDSVQRTDRRAFIAFVRVMRQRDETIRRGSIYIDDETFAGAGPDDAARNGAIARALVWWLAEHPAIDPFFQLRASLNQSGETTTLEMVEDEGTV
jgi:hypothetical protein